MIVADASVAAKWFIEEADTEKAAALLGRERIAAPEFVIAEILSAVWKQVRLKRVVPDQMRIIAQSAAGYFARLYPLLDLAPAAASVSMDLDHPVYDCFYVALAKREGVELVTADDRLYRKTRRTRFSQIVRKLA